MMLVHVAFEGSQGEDHTGLIASWVKQVNGVRRWRQGNGAVLGIQGGDSNLSYLMPGWWRARRGVQC